MKKRIKPFALIIQGLFIINQANAGTPLGQEKLSLRLKDAKSTLKLRQYKTNAKGTILEATEGAFSTPEDWFNLSPRLDDVQGLSTNRVYAEIGEPTTTKDIVVAVIDSGVDVNHEDLQGKIWINEDEIPNNGIDDDNNGYVDDIFGWNFIGNQNGMAQIIPENNENGLRLIPGDPKLQVAADTLEVTREYSRLLKLKKELELKGETLSEADATTLKEAEEEINRESSQALNNFKYYEDNLKTYKASEEILKNEGGLTEITYEAVEKVEASTDSLAVAKKNMLELLDKGLSIDFIQEELNNYDAIANYNYNPKRDTRAEIVKDNYADPFEKFYGNNDVIGPDAFHGTHVSGIIAANRDNQIGINGIAKKVKIMAIRCVPNGDERDKDVANSIIYAVDNGAKIINMSFGKSFSPYKNAVNAAVKYAEEKGVLLVHAAGNSYANNDTTPGFPNRIVDDREAINWLEIGASNYKKDQSLAAGFSNYGKKTVDIFAPGVNIYSTTPNNKYEFANGTSMATPAVAGVAALVLSFNNELNAKELKDLIINTTNRYPKLYVFKARVGQVLFSDLSIYGGIPNSYDAVLAAIEKKEEQQIIPIGENTETPRRRSFLRRLFTKN